MEDIKTQPIETSAVADPIGPCRQLRQRPRRRLEFGPALADGYAPTTLVRAPRQQRSKRPTAVRRSGLSTSSRPVVDKKIISPSPNLRPQIEQELAEVRRAWQKYQTTRCRAAVYIYLEEVYALVTKWGRQNCALKNSRAALRLQANTPTMKREPFGIVIFCTCDPSIVDAKTRSKWSRALRYARKAKPTGQPLTDFIKGAGGLNECARRFAQSNE
jgi:hypothetical protein